MDSKFGGGCPVGGKIFKSTRLLPHDSKSMFTIDEGGSRSTSTNPAADAFFIAQQQATREFYTPIGRQMEQDLAGNESRKKCVLASSLRTTSAKLTVRPVEHPPLEHNNNHSLPVRAACRVANQSPLPPLPRRWLVNQEICSSASFRF